MIKKFNNLKEEFEYLTPNYLWIKTHDTNSDGTITDKKLNIFIRYGILQKCVEVCILKHPALFYTVSLLSGILIITIAPIIGILYYLLVGCTLITFKTIKRQYKAIKEIQRGIQAYNSTKIEEALEIFKNAQNIAPEFANYLNDWIREGLIRINKPEEALAFTLSHDLTSKRLKILFSYIDLKRYSEALEYFNNTFSDEEIIQCPLVLKYQAQNYYHIYGVKAAIEYLLSKKIDRMFMSKELCHIYNLLAKYYQEINDYNNAQNIYTRVLNYSQNNEEAKIGLDKINNMNNN